MARVVGLLVPLAAEDGDFELHQRIAGDPAAPFAEGLELFERRGQILRRQAVGRHGREQHDGNLALRRGLHANAKLGEELLAGDQPVAFADDFDGVVDRLAVADLRLVELDVQIEIAQQAILDDLQVQLAHAADQRLARFAALHVQRGVLPLEHVQRVVAASSARCSIRARSPSR